MSHTAIEEASHFSHQCCWQIRLCMYKNVKIGWENRAGDWGKEGWHFFCLFFTPSKMLLINIVGISYSRLFLLAKTKSQQAKVYYKNFMSCKKGMLRITCSIFYYSFIKQNLNHLSVRGSKWECEKNTLERFSRKLNSVQPVRYGKCRFFYTAEHFSMITGLRRGFFLLGANSGGSKWFFIIPLFFH